MERRAPGCLIGVLGRRGRGRSMEIMGMHAGGCREGIVRVGRGRFGEAPDTRVPLGSERESARGWAVCARSLAGPVGLDAPPFFFFFSFLSVLLLLFELEFDYSSNSEYFLNSNLNIPCLSEHFIWVHWAYIFCTLFSCLV